MEPIQFTTGIYGVVCVHKWKLTLYSTLYAARLFSWIGGMHSTLGLLAAGLRDVTRVLAGTGD